jgi:hypothetical protein
LYVSTATFFLLHCDEWDRVVALPRHKFVTGATLLQLAMGHWMTAVFINNKTTFHKSVFFSLRQNRLSDGK